MKSKLNKMFKIKYFVALITALFLSYYIWFVYIRARLPRDIPFELNFINIILLFFICFIYGFILLRMIKPKKPNTFLLKILEKTRPLYKPIYMFDEFLRQDVLTKCYLNKFIAYLGKIFKGITNNEKNLILYIFWYILPRIILVSLLITDTFYFMKIKHVYSFTFLSLWILFCYYIIYCIRLYINEYTNYLARYYMVEITSKNSKNTNFFCSIDTLNWDHDINYPTEDIPHTMKIDRFIQYQKAALWFDYTLYEYKCSLTWNIVHKYHLEDRIDDLEEIPDDLRIFLEKEFYDLIPNLIQLQLFIETYDFNIKHPRIKRLQILITSLYFICWLYIFYSTLFTLTLDDIITFFIYFQPPNNPFI